GMTTQDLTTEVTWSPASAAVATISNAGGSQGLATSVAAGGPITITATLGGISGNTTLTVTAATLTSIAVTPANPSLPLGLTRQFTATGTFSDSTMQDLTTQVTWSSSSPGVATISRARRSKGLATATRTVSVTRTATLGSISRSPSVSVPRQRFFAPFFNLPPARSESRPRGGALGSEINIRCMCTVRGGFKHRIAPR